MDHDIAWYKNRYHQLLDDSFKASTEIEELKRCKRDLKVEMISMNKRMTSLKETAVVLYDELAIKDRALIDRLIKECRIDQE